MRRWAGRVRAARHIGGRRVEFAVRRRFGFKARFTLGKSAAEDEVLTKGLDRAAGAEKFEIPPRIRGIAVKHRADEAFGFDHQFTISAETGVCERDRFRAGRAEKVARGKHVDARYFQISGVDAAAVTGIPSGKALGKHARLFVDWL